MKHGDEIRLAGKWQREASAGFLLQDSLESAGEKKALFDEGNSVAVKGAGSSWESPEERACKQQWAVILFVSRCWLFALV